jgi:DNA-binding MarR family transcriptional regulator
MRGFDLWREAMRWQRAVDAALAPLELTHTQFLVLTAATACVALDKDAVLQRKIAGAAGLDEATTSRVVRTLSRRGLLDRGATFGDKRAWRILVTPRGKQLETMAERKVRAVARTFFDSSPARRG